MNTLTKIPDPGVLAALDLLHNCSVGLAEEVGGPRDEIDAAYALLKTALEPQDIRCTETTRKGTRCQRRSTLRVAKTGALVCKVHGEELGSYGLKIEEI